MKESIALQIALYLAKSQMGYVPSSVQNLLHWLIILYVLFSVQVESIPESYQLVCLTFPIACIISQIRQDRSPALKAVHTLLRTLVSTVCKNVHPIYSKILAAHVYLNVVP